MTIPVWNPETLAYELPPLPRGLFGLPDWTMMNCTGDYFGYVYVLDILALIFPFILIAFFAICVVFWSMGLGEKK